MTMMENSIRRNITEQTSKHYGTMLKIIARNLTWILFHLKLEKRWIVS